MVDSSILRISTPLAGRPALEVRPSPVLELAYAYYCVMKRFDAGRDSHLPWLKELRDKPPQWLIDLRGLWAEQKLERAGYELFLAACALGYAADPTAGRFLADIEGIPQRMLATLDAAKEELLEDKHDDKLRVVYQAMGDARWRSRMQASLTSLWKHLEPAWDREGRAISEQAALRLSADVESAGDLLAALPAHHFVQFEESASEIREHLTSGRVFVVPLYFAANGGFNLDIGETIYIGFGVHGESVFEQQQRDVTDLAQRLKAFSDPTRLLLLVLIARLRKFPLTVGDLAKQVGVSQPTASGHLKLLREMGLVDVVKEGNRSFYRLDEAAIASTLEELRQALAS